MAAVILPPEHAPAAWSVPEHYHVGDQRSWSGVILVCTFDHYAGCAAEHPWDPGDGWEPATAALLWTPNGRDECIALSQVLAQRTVTAGIDRLYRVLDEVVRIP